LDFVGLGLGGDEENYPFTFVFLEFPIEHKPAHKSDILLSEKFRRNETFDPGGFR
jgi:hypothetical protein